MGKFYCIPGLPPHGGEGRMGMRGRPGVRLPDPTDNPRFKEFFDNREETSHTRTGLDGWAHVNKEVGWIEGEEHDQHSGRVEQIVHRSELGGSGTHKVVWEPGDGPREMVISDVRRIHE